MTIVFHFNKTNSYILLLVDQMSDSHTHTHTHIKYTKTNKNKLNKQIVTLFGK